MHTYIHAFLCIKLKELNYSYIKLYFKEVFITKMSNNITKKIKTKPTFSVLWVDGNMYAD